MITKKDPFTGEEFIPKRKNQKFANQLNKTNYNNELARQEREIRKEVDSAIIKNYRILKTILEDEDQKEMTKLDLISEGFNFQFFNHFKHLQFKGIKYQFLGIYQFMYAFLDDKKTNLLIIKFDENDLH